MLRERKELSDLETIQRSEKIQDNIISSELFQKSKIVLAYLAFKNEVLTSKIIEKCREQKKEICVPGFSHDRQLTALKHHGDFVEGPYGIRQPLFNPNKVVPIEEIDLIIVPGVAFDTKGNRLGWGKGYYDKFLQSSKSTKAGICYEFQLLDEVPSESHDIKMNYIFSDGRVIKC